MTQENKNLQDETISEETTENPASENNEIATLRDQLARAQADYQNLKMRGERDRADMVHFLTEKLLSPLLTQIDNLDRAVKIKDGVTDDAFVDGVRAVQSGLQKYLENQGVQAFDSIGQEVDPDKHEVLSQAPGKEGIIVTEFEKGYMLGDRVLRHAKVIVGAGE
ncbi:nucleotide exchange factor GrpE [Candidatus Gracilibacteria bacterium]|nr:nucleotide exchange factor GrpE [Candidatus Gracilibacteria bacterium]